MVNFRCMLDTMRLVDLLLVLLLEGRSALPKSGTGGVTSRIPGLRRLDSTGERSHRQLIDCIRSKDTDALIDAIDSGSKTNIFLAQNCINFFRFESLQPCNIIMRCQVLCRYSLYETISRFFLS